MASVPAQLFRTVPREEHLGFWSDQVLDLKKVADFLELSKPDIARIAAVSAASVRFDQKAPKLVHDRLAEAANLCEQVAQHFHGNAQKTALWFRTPNPLLQNLSPRDLIRDGHHPVLRQFVAEALGGELTSAAAPAPQRAPSSILQHAREFIARHGAQLLPLCERHGVRRLALFGSALGPGFDPELSDLDMTVEFLTLPDRPAELRYSQCKAALEHLFDRPVDLVELGTIEDSRLKRLISSTQLSIYERAD